MITKFCVSIKQDDKKKKNSEKIRNKNYLYPFTRIKGRDISSLITRLINDPLEQQRAFNRI